MKNILVKLSLVFLLFSFISCKSPYKSLYSNKKSISFINKYFAQNEEIEFTYISSIYYSTSGKANSKKYAQRNRKWLQKSMDSLVDLNKQKINITKKISLKDTPLEDTINNNLLKLIQQIDDTDDITHRTVSPHFRRILDKSPTTHTVLFFNNINFITFQEKNPNSIVLPYQKDFLSTRDITHFLFIFNNKNKELMFFSKSKKIKNRSSKFEDYSFYESELLKFINH